MRSRLKLSTWTRTVKNTKLGHPTCWTWSREPGADYGEKCDFCNSAQDGSKGEEKESDPPRSACGGEHRDTVVLFLLFMARTHFAPIREGGLRAH